jgi:hypothetical protein
LGIYRKADSRFHFALLEESGNRYLMNAYHLGAAALEALRVRVRLQGGKNNFREQSFNEHIDMAKLLRAGKIDEACTILRRNILVINDFLHTFPLNPEKGSRKGLSSARDYAEVFSRSDRRDGGLSFGPRRDGSESELSRLESQGRKSTRPDRGTA